jgi:hypothetical protein
MFAVPTVLPSTWNRTGMLTRPVPTLPWFRITAEIVKLCPEYGLIGLMLML